MLEINAGVAQFQMQRRHQFAFDVIGDAAEGFGLGTSGLEDGGVGHRGTPGVVSVLEAVSGPDERKIQLVGVDANCGAADCGERVS